MNEFIRSFLKKKPICDKRLHEENLRNKIIKIKTTSVSGSRSERNIISEEKLSRIL